MSESAGGTRKTQLLLQRWAREETRNRIAVNANDGSVLVYIPGGEFEMGSAAGEGYENERPKHRVELAGYWIGVYAVTNRQYLKFIEATGYRAPGNTKYRESGLAEHPVTNVDWDDSVAYAKWAGCELASEAQWEKACRGPLGLEYPWGREWDASKCRHDKNKGQEQTCAVHGYPMGISGYGTYNQSGNVWEWCADWYGKKYYGESAKVDPRGPVGGSRRAYRGGGWGNSGLVVFWAAFRYWLDPGYRLENLGLRLVRTAS